MNRYSIQIPREYRCSFTVDARDIHEARFEAIKQLVKDVLDQHVPLDIGQGSKVEQCDMCTVCFSPTDLTEVEEKWVCANCVPYARGEVPDIW